MYRSCLLSSWLAVSQTVTGAVPTIWCYAPPTESVTCSPGLVPERKITSLTPERNSFPQHVAQIGDLQNNALMASVTAPSRAPAKPWGEADSCNQETLHIKTLWSQTFTLPGIQVALIARGLCSVPLPGGWPGTKTGGKCNAPHPDLCGAFLNVYWIAVPNDEKVNVFKCWHDTLYWSI